MVRILSVVDAYTRECRALEAGTRLGSGRVPRVLERVIAERGRPDNVRSDNGPEFTSRRMIGWAEDWKAGLPTLPKRALHKLRSKDCKDPSQAGAQTASTQCGPIDQNATAKIEGFLRLLGNGIYREILWRVARVDAANAIPNAQLQNSVVDVMERATREIHRANALAEAIGDAAFISVLDRLEISSMATIGSLEIFKRLVLELELLEEWQAA